MEGLIIFSLLFMLLNSNYFARDFVVELAEEKYREFQYSSEKDYSSHIFHSIHINLDDTQNLKFYLIITSLIAYFTTWTHPIIRQSGIAGMIYGSINF